MKIGILGTGAYGIAQSKILIKNGHEVTLWSRFEDEVQRLVNEGENSKVLPGVKFDLNLKITNNLEECVLNSDIVVIAIPTVAVRSVAKDLKPLLKPEQIICITTKGIEHATNKLISEIVKEETGTENIVVFTGPSFASEIANDAKAGFVVASKNIELAERVKSIYVNENIVFEISDDVEGIQICSSIKNVFAIVTGMLSSINKNDSTFAAMLTVLLKDMKKIVKIFNGKEDTVHSYAGIGDFLLTCTSSKSRNYTFGKYIGMGLSKERALEEMQNYTVEGLGTLESIYDYLSKKNIYVESIYVLYDIVYNYHNPEEIYKCMK